MMSRGQNPLVLMMALSMPAAAHALGLGEISVDSALNEPLAADIEIVGASPEDLAGLSAAVANKDTFAHFGADRPAFLASTSFKVAQDAGGRPILAIRSSESFTEPLVNLVLDLRWHNGELVRQYTLLLDPATIRQAAQPMTPAAAPTARTSALAPVPALASASASASTSAPVSAPAASPAVESAHAPIARRTHLKVGAKATLRGVAWRVGARSEPDLERLMLAIFRANPNSFEGNINRLKRGAILNIPAAADVAAISRGEAGREIQAQMSAWHAPSADTAVVAASDEAAALSRRIRSLESGLHDMQARMDHEHDKMLSLQARLRYVETPAPVAAPAPGSAAVPSRPIAASIAGSFALLAAALAAIYWRATRRGRAPAPTRYERAEPTASEPALEPSKVAESGEFRVLRAAHEPQTPAHPVTTEESSWVPADPIAESAAESAAAGAATALMLRDAQAAAEKRREAEEVERLREELANAKLQEEIAAAWASATAEMATVEPDTAATALLPTGNTTETSDTADTVNLGADLGAAPGPATTQRVDITNLDYNFMDLDMTAQHVQMPSVLHEHVVVKERRTNLVDVLRMAIAREPERRDLRIKLLEVYYAAAATNRKGFLDVVEKLARERDELPEGAWEKISSMGRQIAADTELFAEETTVNAKLADCA